VQGAIVARRTNPATAVIVIAAMLGMAAIAKAAQEDGPRWPSIYEPQWPNLKGEPGYDAAKPTPAPAAQPEIVTGSVPPSQVEKRWHDFKAERTIVIPAFEGEMGLRYWYSWGKTQKDLYIPDGSAMISRLTYDGLQGHSAELFGRVDFNSGFFVKGTLGAGILTNGNLNDEDFEPFIVPYSSTDSKQRDGHLAYVSADLGFNVIRQKKLRLGVFAGYHYYDQKVSAYGCTQVATNPAICGVFPVPNDILVISQNNRWQSLRVGFDATIGLSDRFSLHVDAAWLPYVRLDGQDFHWLRIGTNPGDFAGGLPEDGKGNGWQLEAAISYAVSENVRVAVGGRYWRMETNGYTHFEGNIVGGTGRPQPVDWSVESMGVFVQGSFKFGPYPIGSF
jgi:outer membrane protease